MDTPGRSPIPLIPNPAAPAVARATVFLVTATVLAFLLGASQPALARATTIYGLTKTYPNPSLDVNAEFGNAVSWLPAGDKFIAGARSDNGGGAIPVGVAYILSATTGAVTHVFTETGTVSNDYYGYAVAISGTRALIGAPLNDFGAQDAGSAYLYDANTGLLLQTFHSPGPDVQSNFGSSVAILSDTAVLIGAPLYSITDTGRAYVCLIADGSCPTAIDSPSVAPAGGFFGLSVAALGDKFAVAAPYDNSHGRVYVFTTTTGALYETLPLSLSVDNFGSALAAINGDLLVGAQYAGTSVVNTAGAAFLYSPTGILLRSFYNPDSTDSSARFGAAVAADGNLAIIGAPGASTNEGRAYIFNTTTGALVDTLQKSAPATGDLFGAAVAVLGEDFLVGAPGGSQPGAPAGAIYRFGVQTQFNLFLPLVRR